MSGTDGLGKLEDGYQGFEVLKTTFDSIAAGFLRKPSKSLAKQLVSLGQQLGYSDQDMLGAVMQTYESLGKM